MLIDEVGDITITNDGATILKLLDVDHPTAKIMVELAQLQDDEVGDGTTTVVLLCAAMLEGALNLYSHKVHPTNIINGFRVACREVCKYIKNKMVLNVDKLDESYIINAASTAMSSKLINR